MARLARIQYLGTILAGSLWLLGDLSAVEITPLADKVVPVIADRQDFQVPDRTRLTGWVGERIEANEANRLAKLDATRLLEGYRKRPGRQSWDGEHVGKWLHAATLAWVYTGDPGLRQKLDEIATELVKCQLGDGYLGTYEEKNRWRSWDVWAHKYNLIGLLTYVRYTGNTAPLGACCRMADLLCNTFGEEAGKRDIIKSGPQVGMAPTSVLEPMVLLYRLTGEPRYLEFCRYILRAWELPHGPRIISKLLAGDGVHQIANGKAYEMLSCLNGALEYYRTTGEAPIFRACLNAWRDIVDHRLYLTGAASYWEIFHEAYDLPNVNNVGETCVTVTWIQFNAQLLRLTGEARFADQLEHVILNQLLGAQRCDGAAWGYYVQMEGTKPYSTNLDGHCCLSSGPRGIALIPTFALTTDADGIVVNLYDAGSSQLRLRDHTEVALKTETRYPGSEKIHITVELAEAKSFAIKLRLPAWCGESHVEVNGRKTAVKRNPEGYAVIQREWKNGDRVGLRFKLEPRLITGDHLNHGKVALTYGPLVLAADEALLGEAAQAGSGAAALPAGKAGLPLNAIAVADAKLARLKFKAEPAPDRIKNWAGQQVFRIRGVTRKAVGGVKPGVPLGIRLVAFADAGVTGSHYKVWLPLPRELYRGNVLLDAVESRSRPGDLAGLITDEDFETAVCTRDGKKAEEDWFAVELTRPATIQRVVFAHGKTFHDGGWFDASAGKPRIQVQRTKNGAWETVSEIAAYPATTPKDSGEMDGGENFNCPLPAPVRAWGIRVIGKPAGGDNPQQAFSSCAELQAFGE